MVRAAATKPEEGGQRLKAGPAGVKENGSRKPEKPQAPKLPPIPPPKQKPFVEVLGQKLLDTGDDVFMHASRAFRGHVMETPTAGGFQHGEGVDVYTSNKPIVLVLGFGWASHSLAKVRHVMDPA